MLTRTDAHVTTWVIAILLFILALFLHRAGREKAFKTVQMVLRLFYILVIVTGALLFFHNQRLDPALYGLKLLGGILVIGMMEMITLRLAKRKRTGMLWVLLIIFFSAVLYLGLRLPMGWHPFY
ncbi:YisL family protein [Heyndrickxia coagulans]|uniref:YisL family protein n=1 Tax=Heyndrickxia coagulans TaxID=1398 RepID=UPI0028FA83E7|nr:YisL family protein [Heyndrickxia coagulans]MDT9755381.1 YisL family protein [Heyndrickxia coagulans]